MAACMLVTGAVMPLVTQVPLFGIIELCLGLQFSVFPTIGLMKVRKPFALILISLFCGIFFAFMFLPMFVCAMICAVIVEASVLLIFRGYKRDAACVVAGTLYMPMTLPFLFLWYNVIYTVNPAEDGKAVQAFVGADPGVAVGISVAVLALCFVGAMVGMVISKELKKAGVLKNEIFALKRKRIRLPRCLRGLSSSFSVWWRRKLLREAGFCLGRLRGF